MELLHLLLPSPTCQKIVCHFNIFLFLPFTRWLMASFHIPNQKKGLVNNNVIESVRTYHYSLNSPAWLQFMVMNRIHVVVGITLSQYSMELTNLSKDYRTANATLKHLYDTYVLAIAIGNEETDTVSINAGISLARSMQDEGFLPINAKLTTVLQETDNWIVKQNFTF